MKEIQLKAMWKAQEKIKKMQTNKCQMHCMEYI